MLLDRIIKEPTDRSRIICDLSAYLDDTEVVSQILSAEISLGSPGWALSPYPPPGAGPPYDPTPLLFHSFTMQENNRTLVVFVNYGTPGNTYTCTFVLVGTSARHFTFELGVQVSGVPPKQQFVALPVPPTQGAWALPLAGGTMQGPLYLYEDPTYPTEAATKYYVDHVAGIVGGPFLPIAGGVLTGPLLLAGDPLRDTEAATKHYVDTHGGGGSGGAAHITVSDQPPALVNGALWFDSNATQLMVGYDDSTSLQWVIATNPPQSSGGVSEIDTGTGLTGGPITQSGTIALTDTSVTPGSYANANITVDQQGRITVAANGQAGVGGSGTVQNVQTGTGLTGGPITQAGTIALQVPVSLANGGTGATNAAAALTSLGAASAASLANYAPLNAPVFTGDARAVTAPPGDNDTSIATTAFVQAAIAGGAAVTISDTPPANPAPAALWWCSADGNLYTYFSDPNSSQWVIANSGGIPEAPADGGVYARSNSAWANITVASAAGPNNTGRNLVHNGLFNINQRTGPWTVGGYTLDRWWLALSGSDTASVTQQPLIDSDRAQIGNEAAEYSLQINYTGTSGGSTNINHGIEDVRRLANRTVTVSFWARASVAGRQLGVWLLQRMGTGGSPSSDVGVGSPTAVPITTSFQRYSVTITLPSLTGKTLGTNGDHHTLLRILFSDSSIGTQTAIASIWGVQLEYGSVATPLAVRDPADELALCQRFYSVSTTHALIYATTNQYWLVGPVTFPVTMRSYPTVVIGAVISPDANLGIGITADNVTPYGCRTFSSSAASGQANYSRYILASADL